MEKEKKEGRWRKKTRMKELGRRKEQKFEYVRIEFHVVDLIRLSSINTWDSSL